MKKKVQTRANQTTKVILSVVAVVGLLAVGAVAPNALKLLKYAPRFKKQSYNRTYYLNKITQKLVDQGLLKIIRNQTGRGFVRLTAAGKKELQHYELGEKTIIKSKRWDGKYRLIIFDIKEWKRNVRDELRGWLGQLGFVRLQNSVWVHPYECHEIITLLKSHFHIGKEILYLVVESIENDRWLKKEFGLL